MLSLFSVYGLQIRSVSDFSEQAFDHLHSRKYGRLLPSLLDILRTMCFPTCNKKDNDSNGLEFYIM